MQHPASAFAFSLVLSVASRAVAAEPIRIHLGTGAARAVGGTQGSEFATGAVGDATVELPAATRIGLQASAGAVVLAKGDPKADPNVQPTSTGVAFLGTAGVRVRAFGGSAVGGPWLDSGFGVAHTGGLTRPAVSAHLGWDFRVSREGRVDVGPYLGYLQIVQPDSELRGHDARVLTAGLSVSLGARARPKGAPPAPPSLEPAPPSSVAPPPPPPDERVAEDQHIVASEPCPDGEAPAPEGCGGAIRIVEDRILLEDVIHFEFGSAKIRARSFRVVKRLARFIVERDEPIEVSIEGHTDEVGSQAYNQTLSVERATAMRELLVYFGAPARQLHVIGHGKSRLKVVTPRAEEANRRVELFVTPRRNAEDEARPGEDASAAAPRGKSAW